MRVVLTREAGRNDEMRAWLPDHASVTELPLTSTRYVELSEVDRLLRSTAPRYGEFAALVVTSSRTKPYVATAQRALRAGAAVLSVGPATTRSLQELGVAISAEAPSRALDLANHIVRGPVLLLGAGEMRDELTSALEARSIEVTHVACYHTLAETLSGEQQDLLGRAQVVLIGAPTAWVVAQPFVNASTLVVVPGAATASVVLTHHERVLEGWGPSLRERLGSLED